MVSKFHPDFASVEEAFESVKTGDWTDVQFRAWVENQKDSAFQYKQEQYEQELRAESGV